MNSSPTSASMRARCTRRSSPPCFATGRRVLPIKRLAVLKYWRCQQWNRRAARYRRNGRNGGRCTAATGLFIPAMRSLRDGSRHFLIYRGTDCRRLVLPSTLGDGAWIFRRLPLSHSPLAIDSVVPDLSVAGLLRLRRLNHGIRGGFEYSRTFRSLAAIRSAPTSLALIPKACRSDDQ